MRQHWRPGLFFVLMLTGCGTSHVWEDKRELVPTTYQFVEEKQVKRNIGKLRRLILLPAKLRYSEKGPLLESGVTPDQLLDDFARKSADYLAHTKGYELAPLQTRVSVTSSKALNEDIKNYVEVLAIWAAESTDGADPPDEVLDAAKVLGHSGNADGIMLLQGWGKELSDTAYLAVVATASLAWPIIFADTKVSLSADLYEVSSGRIVWRSRVTSTNADHMQDLRHLVWDLLKPIEEALPSVFVTR